MSKREADFHYSDFHPWKRGKSVNDAISTLNFAERGKPDSCMTDATSASAKVCFGAPGNNNIHPNLMYTLLPQPVSITSYMCTFEGVPAAMKTLTEEEKAEEYMFSTIVWSGTVWLAEALSRTKRKKSLALKVHHIKDIFTKDLEQVNKLYPNITHITLSSATLFDPRSLPTNIVSVTIENAEYLDGIEKAPFPMSMKELKIVMSTKHGIQRDVSDLDAEDREKPFHLNTLPPTLHRLEVDCFKLLSFPFPRDLQHFHFASMEIGASIQFIDRSSRAHGDINACDTLMPSGLLSLSIMGYHSTLQQEPVDILCRFTRLASLHLNIKNEAYDGFSRFENVPDTYMIWNKDIPRTVKSLNIETMFFNDSFNNLPRRLQELRVGEIQEPTAPNYRKSKGVVFFRGGHLPPGLVKLTMDAEQGFELSMLPDTLTYLSTRGQNLIASSVNLPQELNANIETLVMDKSILHEVAFNHVKQLTLPFNFKASFQLFLLPRQLTHLTLDGVRAMHHVRTIGMNEIPASVQDINCNNAHVIFLKGAVLNCLESLKIRLYGRNFTDLIKAVRSLPISKSLHLTIGNRYSDTITANQWKRLIAALYVGITKLEITTPHVLFICPSVDMWPSHITHLKILCMATIQPSCGLPPSLRFLTTNRFISSEHMPSTLCNVDSSERDDSICIADSATDDSDYD
jgi:hypothetical protein